VGLSAAGHIGDWQNSRTPQGSIEKGLKWSTDIDSSVAPFLPSIPNLSRMLFM
jgi:hypothetical protein